MNRQRKEQDPQFSANCGASKISIHVLQLQLVKTNSAQWQNSENTVLAKARNARIAQSQSIKDDRFEEQCVLQVDANYWEAKRHPVYQRMAVCIQSSCATTTTSTICAL